jgi:hypothetical protein
MKINESGAMIADAIENWLKAEVVSSGIDNTYLDDYTDAVEWLKLGFEHPDNFSAQKHKSHVENRMPIWWQAFELTQPGDQQFDEQSAKITFNALMQISGTYRNQAFLQAANPEDYLQRRMKGTGLSSLQNVVSDRLATHFLAETWNEEADFTAANIDFAVLEQRMDRVCQKTGEYILTMCSRVEAGKDLGLEHSKSVNEMIDAQYSWLAFAVDCVTYFAKTRGGNLQAVPFLEPKSIAATPPPTVIYPLVSDFIEF